MAAASSVTQRPPRTATCGGRCCRWRPAKWHSTHTRLPRLPPFCWLCTDKSLVLPPFPPYRRYPFKPDQVIQNTDWELYIAQIARECMSDQSPKTLFIIRGRLYELLINAISPELILKKLAAELLSKLDADLKYEARGYARVS